MDCSAIGRNISRMSKAKLHSLKETLRAASRIVVLTGAGISADSGIPTFRDAQTGMWAKYDPQELASPQAFREHPRTVLCWYQWRRSLIEQAVPNPGHRALARLERQAGKQNQSYMLITQNIDDLHRKAGSENLIELHGNIYRHKCFQCNRPWDGVIPSIDENSDLPRCAVCDGLIRPDVVWFGESLSEEQLRRAFSFTRSCDIFLSIGTSTLVHPAASLPMLALDNGAAVVEINPDTTPVTNHVDLAFHSPASQILAELISA